jgi:RNA polymerase sigma factor (sigma-70 family)
MFNEVSMSRLSQKVQVSQEVQDALGRVSPDKWAKLMKYLINYADKAIRTKTWRGVFNGPLPGGKTAEDFVQEAIEKVYIGVRSWNPEQMNLRFFLKQVVRSDISSYVRNSENRIKHLRIRTEAEEDEVDGLEHVIFDRDLPSDEENFEIASREVQQFFDFVKDDEIVYNMVKLQYEEEEVFPRNELAERLGVSRKDVDNAIKRHDRRAKKFRLQKE